MPESTPFAALQPLEPLMDACVHCGFCLPACPSYAVLGQEMASPRGRIYTMRAGLEQRVGLTAPVVQHFDTCLGCMACETACPSGVKYAPLIEETRAAIVEHHERPFGDRLFRRLLFAVLPYPARLRVLAAPSRLVPWLRRSAGLMKLVPARVANLLQLAPTLPSRVDRKPIAALTHATGTSRLSVGLVTGCVQRVFFGDVNHATVRVLAAEGCDVYAPPTQGCCGALALHAGELEFARQSARALIAEFERLPVDMVVVNAAGCGSSLKEYGHLLRDDPEWSARAKAFSAKVRDVTELLAGLTPSLAPRATMAVRVAYHDACHLAHAQGVRKPPRDLLASIPGVKIVPIAEAEMCCGSAGIFNLVQPEMAATLGARKAGHLADAEPDVVLTSNPGCILQLRAAATKSGRPFVIRHIIEFLDEAISRAPKTGR